MFVYIRYIAVMSTVIEVNGVQYTSVSAADGSYVQNDNGDYVFVNENGKYGSYRTNLAVSTGPSSDRRTPQDSFPSCCK